MINVVESCHWIGITPFSGLPFSRWNHALSLNSYSMPGVAKKHRGSSLLLVILLIPILVFLARSVHWLSTTSGHRANLYRKKVAARYLVEAAEAHALSKLKQDADWSEGFDRQTLDDVPGHYSIVFSPPGAPYQPGHSVNNITGDTSVDGPRGPKTVKPGTVEFVVQAEVSGFQTTGEAIFKAKTKPLPSYGLGASGNIVLKGDVSIRGIQNLITQAEVRAGIHSNSLGHDGPTISWQKNSGADHMEVKGTVTTTAPKADSIQLQGSDGVDYRVTEIQTDVAALPMPSTNIVDTVSTHSSLAPPSLNDFGTTRLSGGESYYGGSATLQGDLVLDGHTLYVSGDLTVNGTIRGDGSVYVTGKTTLKGDTEIKANQTGVALYSHGAVELSGFNGDEYLASLRQENPDLDSAIRNYNNSFQPVEFRSIKGGNRTTAYEDTRNQKAPGLLQAFDRKSLEGETASFIRRQLEKQAGFQGQEYQRARSPMVRANRSYQGKLVTNRPPEADFSKLGQAYFQGLIVSDHYVLTDNAVSVVGSLWSTGKHEATPVTIDGKTVAPGDLILNNGTEVVMNQELLEDPRTATRDVTDLELQFLVR